jgi:serine/threonine protein kinase/TolB-like protein
MAPDGALFANSIRFGKRFELDLSAYELRKDGEPQKLGRIPMELLLFLIEQRGQLVTRDQIVEKIWGKDAFLDTDNSINAAIRRVRQVLDDDPDEPKFVLTVVGRGYRFIATVETDSSQRGAMAAGEQTQQRSPGQRIGHYRILNILGGGGMGLVYCAEDLKLGRRVALKFLPDELAADPDAFDRLRREARAASALDHPNICSIYQLEEEAGQPFIVMQLLEGQTLREWIGTAASLPTAKRVKKVVDFAIQIAAGLQAAHEKGIIHRDIKPSNIFVTKQRQAKILDFGVAKVGTGASENENTKAIGLGAPLAQGGALDPGLTSAGISVGTPYYLSPEQIRRAPLDARSDLFSFGLVVYEMATGHRAFSAESDAEIREAVLNRAPVPPRQLDPGLPEELERIIGKCLEKNPSRRYASGKTLGQDLTRLLAEVQSAPYKIYRSLALAIGIAAVALALLFGLNIGGVRERFIGGVSTSALPAVPKARPSVAVLGFKNLSGSEDKAWISTALSEMVATNLAAGERVRLIPGENVARMKLDLALPPTDSFGAETLGKIRGHLGSDLIVLGSYLAIGANGQGKIHLNLQLQNARAGETVAVVSADGTEADLAELVARAGATVREKLGIGEILSADARQVQASLPVNLEAARLYSEGLAKLEQFDDLAARDLLEKAVAAEPGHALSHAALARAWSALGYDAKAAEQAKRALDLSANLPREQRFSIEGSYRQMTHDGGGAIEIYRTLSNFFPDNLDYALHLASLETDNSLGKDALQTHAASSRAQPCGRAH